MFFFVFLVRKAKSACCKKTFFVVLSIKCQNDETCRIILAAAVITSFDDCTGIVTSPTLLVVLQSNIRNVCDHIVCDCTSIGKDTAIM